MGKRRLEKIERIPNSCHRKVSYNYKPFYRFKFNYLKVYIHCDIFHMIYHSIIIYFVFLYLTNYKNGKSEILKNIVLISNINHQLIMLFLGKPKFKWPFSG